MSDQHNNYRVNVVAHTKSAANPDYAHELLTFAIQGPRPVLAEFNTHRALCLAGDVVLEFDLPAGTTRGHRRVHRMRLEDFVDKWHNGARRTGANPKAGYDLAWVKPDERYTADECAAYMGMANATNINTACRRGVIPADKVDRVWFIRGSDLIRWRQSAPAHTRFDMRARLAAMRIRQLNEDTGDIQYSTVTDAVASGLKTVYEVVAGDYRVTGTADHRIYTPDGWRTIAELRAGSSHIVVAKDGLPEDERRDPMRLRKIGGVWRSAWQRDERERLIADDPLCRRCRGRSGVDVHHLIPVCDNPVLAFDRSNITLLCNECHDGCHRNQNWQVSKRLYGAAVLVTDIRSVGDRPTFDLSIAGKYPNFLANGVVVHNCRNVESSRAISVPRRVEMLRENPYVPGPTPDGLPLLGDNRGMVAVTPLTDWQIDQGQQIYRSAAGVAADAASSLHGKGWHKQDVNRLTEPFSWTRIVASGTRAAWNHFFWLRTAADVYPPLRVLARAMCVAAHRSIPRLTQPQQPNGVTHYQSWHLPYIGSGEEAVAIRTARERWGAVSLMKTKRYEDDDDIGPFRSLREARLLGWDLAVLLLCRWSAARCATVSYYKFGDVKGYPELEARFDTLFPPDDLEAAMPMPPKPVHASPAEHQAQLVCDQMVEPGTAGNFAGPWRQYRKCLPGEFQPAYTPSAAALAGWNIPESMFEPLT